MKATAIAPANIAFIKYWGKVNPLTRVPSNSSLSMNLSNMQTITTVEFNPKFTKDSIAFLDEDLVTKKEQTRICEALDRVREFAKQKYFARVATKNSFPKAAGIASSASGFASLAVAAFAALGVSLEEKELSKFCRTLSGTASRSIPGGFVVWQKGTGPDDSYAYQLYPEHYWDICDVVAIVSKKMKKIGSTEGHAIADTSPFYNSRMMGMEKKIHLIKDAMQKKDFFNFGNILEAEAMNMHAICFTSNPPLIYWEPVTLDIMKKVIGWREAKKVESYFTIDAGPSVHVICEGKDAMKIADLLSAISGVHQVVVNKPAQGVKITTDHLF